MKKRKSVIAACCMVLACCASLTGCGGGSDSAGTAQVTDSAGAGQVTISFLGNKVEIHDAMQAAVNRYMELNPDVKITFETIGGGADSGGDLKARVSSDSMPTIFAVSGTDAWNEWADYLEDLSDQPWVEYVADSAITQCSNSEGQVLGIPYAVEGYGFVYNKRIFEAAGIDAGNLKTYDEIDAAFGALKEKIDNGELADEFPLLESVMEFPVKETWVTGLHTVNLELNQEYGSEEEAYLAKELGFTYADALKNIIDLQVKYTANAEEPTKLNSVDYSISLGGGLAIERVAVIQQGNWINAEVEAVDSELANNLGIIPIPMKGVQEDGSIPVGVPGCYNVNKKATEEEKAAAKDFLNWLFQSDEGKQIVINDFMFIPAFTNYDGLEASDSLSQEIKNHIDEGTTTSWVFSGSPEGFMDYFGQQVQAYVSQKTTWDDLVENCKKYWADTRAK